MLDAHSAKLRIVPNQVRQLAALLHQISLRQARDALLENPRIPSSSHNTNPESLKLRVWSKSEASRKCLGWDVAKVLRCSCAAIKSRWFVLRIKDNTNYLLEYEFGLKL